MKALKFLGFLLTVFFLGACAPKTQFITTYTDPKAPKSAVDSVRADLSLLISNQGKTEHVNAVVFAVPGERYRIELTGPLGVTVASILWLPQQWTMLLPSEGLYHHSQGDFMQIPATVLPPLNIHQTMGVLWGQLLPESWRQAQRTPINDSLEALVWSDASASFEAVFNSRNGQIVSLTTQKEYLEEVRYTNYKRFGDLTLPQKTEIIRNGQRVLKIHLSAINPAAVWKSSVWQLQIPNDFKQIP
jgi:outer membrane biogenesis lipoprotein LolB